MYVAPNNRLSNHFRKKRVEKQVWVDDQTVSSSFYQNIRTMREKTNIQMLYENYLNPDISFSNNHQPNIFYNNSYPHSLQNACKCFGTNLFNHDDGLSDWEEAARYGTNWRDEDCDDDSLLDGEEINTYHTDPNNPDTDNDRILDGHNVTLDISDSHEYYLWLSDDWQNKYYHDGYTFLGELSYGTNANNSDTDNDEMRDGWEAYYGTKPTDFDSGEDPDYDNLTNIQEWENKTHPTNPDTDFDALLDFDEIVMGTDPLCSDSDNDGLIDGVDNQPMAWWDMDWKFAHSSLPDVSIREFAVLTKYCRNDYQKYYCRDCPSNEEVTNALRKNYPDAVIDWNQSRFLDYLGVPSEIYPEFDVFDDNGEPRFEYRFELKTSGLSDVQDYYYTNLSWVLEPDADQKINFQVTFDKSLNDMFGFVVNLCDVNGTGYSDIPYATLYSVGNNLTDDNRSYDVSVQIPWNCVPSVSPKEVLIDMRPVFINYILNETGAFESINLTSLNVSEFGLKMSSVQAEIVKKPHLLAVRPDLNFESFRNGLPNDIFTFYAYNNSGYVHNDTYRISWTYYKSQRTFWGPVCVKNIANKTTGSLLGFVVVARFLQDVENYKNYSSYLWSGLNPEKLPVVNMSMGYVHNTLFVKGLVDEVNDPVVCWGDPSVVRPQSVTNSTQIFVFNDTTLGLYFYARYDLSITPQSPNLESLSLMQDFAFAFGTSVNERSEYSKSLPVSQDLSWIDSVIANNVSTFGFIVLTDNNVFIGLHQGDSVSLSLYALDASLLVGDVVIRDPSSLPPEVLAMLDVLGLASDALGKVGTVINIILFCIEIHPVVMDFNDAQSGEFKTIYGLTIVNRAMIFTVSLAIGIAVGIAVTAAAGPIAGIILGGIAAYICEWILTELVSAGVFDLDTPQGIVITFLFGPIGWTAAWIQEESEKVTATIKARTIEWVRNRQQEKCMVLIIR